MADQQHISINLDDVLDLLRNGVRRADVFMGIGLNAAVHDPPISHLLATNGLHNIRLVKEDLTPEERIHVAAEFGKWIRANGLRELIETFSLFLDRLYLPLFLITKKHNEKGEKLSVPDRFEQLGISDKIDLIARVLVVGEADRRVLASLNQARNCYAHRRGIVGERDVDNDTRLASLCWNAFQLEVHEPTGNILTEEEIFGRVLEQGGTVSVRVVERRRTFPLGAELILEKQDLKEICLSVLSIGQRLLHETIQAAREARVLEQTNIDEGLNDPKPV